MYTVCIVALALANIAIICVCTEQQRIIDSLYAKVQALTWRIERMGR